MIQKENILNAEALKTKSDNEVVTGLFLVKEYTKKSTKTGSFYIDGVLECKGTLFFKAWGNSDAFDVFQDYDLSGKVCMGVCKVNLYGGSLSLIVDTVKPINLDGTGITISDFFTSKYDVDSYFSAILGMLKKSVDEPSQRVFQIVMKDLVDRFKVEFAAKGHHDNCRGGLVAHTYKVLYMMKMVKFYTEILRVEGNLNLLYLGAALHDIGKVYEYSDGAISGMGKIVSHHTFGVEILVSHKDEIVALVGEEFFYRLCAVIEQHHGEYEETPRTIEAYIIHLVDKFESSLQVLDQKLEGLNRGDQIQIDTMKLI